MISACMICLNEEKFIKMCLTSLLGCVDEIIIVDGGSTDKTLDIIDEMNNPDIKVFHKKWKGNYGKQREFAVRQAKGDWIYQIDCDEVLGDTGYLLREYAKKDFDVYNIEYVHFIRDLGHIDATQEVHISQNRFFRNKNVVYNRAMHELAHSDDWKNMETIRDIKVYHLGGLRDIIHVQFKFYENMNKSTIHNKEFLEQWRSWYMMGTYPTKLFEGKYPTIVEKAFNL